MQRRVQGPDGTVHDFPDDVTDAEISAVLNARPASITKAPPQAKVRTWTDVAVDWLPTMGGIAGGIAGGVAGGPPGAIAGSMLGGAAGEGYKQTARFAQEQPVPSSATQMVGKMGRAAFEQGAGELIGQGVAMAGVKVARGIARPLMTSALKPGLKESLKSVRSGQTSPLVKTLLDEGVGVTERGVQKLNALINSTNDDIKAAIADASGTVNPYKVTQKLGETAKTFADQVNPSGDLEAISRVGQEFLETHGGGLSVQDAQRIKQGTYKQLGGKYGELKGAEIEAQKALARGLKDEIAAEIDQSLAGLKGKLGMEGGVDISGLNARESALLQARDAVARRVVTATRRDPLGLGALAMSHPLTFVTVLLDRSPAVKSLLARGLYTPAARVAGVSPELLKTAIGAIASDTSSETPAGPEQ